MGKRKCSLDDCDSPVRARGWCKKHWRAWRKHGSPYGPPSPVDLPGERWLPVPGWEGFYEVSDLGRVRGMDRVVRKGAIAVPVRGKILAPCTTEYGHYLVNLYRDGKPTKRCVHTLVAAAFLGPCPPGMEVRHGPGGKLDNTPANLSYGTRADNCRDMRRDGTHREGTRIHHAKLTEAVIPEIRARYAAGGVSMQFLADEYGVSLVAIWQVVNRKSWKHVA